MDKETAKVVEDFVKKIKKRIDVEKIILFGSRAKGNNFINSDFDFIIVSKQFRGVLFPKRMAQIYKYWDSPYDIEALCFTPEEFKKKKQQIGVVRQAVREGVILG